MRYTYAHLLADLKKLKPSELSQPVNVGLSNGIAEGRKLGVIYDMDHAVAGKSLLVLDTTV